MYSSPTSHNEPEGSVSYSAIGFASAEFSIDKTGGVSLVANADGLASLANLFLELAEQSRPTHIHLTPAMQLTETSVAFVVSRIMIGNLPDGTVSPTSEESESD